VLAGELSAAKNALVEAERKVGVAAQVVMIEEAEPIAKELQEARQKVWRLIDSLSGLAALWLPSMEGRPRAVAIPQNMLAVLMNDLRPMKPIGVTRPDGEDGSRWQRYYAALCSDADARFKDLRL
jgi:hypothetical protein